MRALPRDLTWLPGTLTARPNLGTFDGVDWRRTHEATAAGAPAGPIPAPTATPVAFAPVTPGVLAPRLNMGCGSRLMPKEQGWVNLDVRDLPGVDVVVDMRSLPFPDAHFEEVLALDCIEHVLRVEQETLFREVHRVLRPGGLLKVKTPNLRTLAEALVKGTIPPEELERKVYANQGGGLQGGDVHLSGNTPESLTARLTRAGFKVQRVMPMLLGEDWSNMAVRALKPASPTPTPPVPEAP